MLGTMVWDIKDFFLGKIAILKEIGFRFFMYVLEKIRDPFYFSMIVDNWYGMNRLLPTIRKRVPPSELVYTPLNVGYIDPQFISVTGLCLPT